jgi:hypothetical protein
MAGNVKATKKSTPYSSFLRRIDDAPDVSLVPIYERHLQEFRKIRIEHPRLLRIRKALNKLRIEARLNRGSEQFVLPIIGPSQSGKTTAIDHYIETVVNPSNPPRGHLPVLKANLSPRASLRQLQGDILSGLVMDECGDVDYSELLSGTEAEFRARVNRYAKLRQTELIVIDEAQHLLRANQRERAKQVADMIKLMAIEGAASFVVVGTDESWPIFHSNGEQTPYRCVEPIILTPLDYEQEYDADLFEGFLAQLDEKYVAHGLTSDYSDFVEGNTPAEFWEVTRGIVGRASRLARIAWEFAFALGEKSVTRDCLAAAVDRWAIPLKLCRSNPFREGARTIEQVKKEWAHHPLEDDAWDKGAKR